LITLTDTTDQSEIVPTIHDVYPIHDKCTSISSGDKDDILGRFCMSCLVVFLKQYVTQVK